MTKLHHNVINSDLQSVKKLVESGASIDIQDLFGWTPLHWAVFKEDEKICRILIKNGASTTSGSNKKWYKYPSGITVVEMAKMCKDRMFYQKFASILGEENEK